MEHEEQHTTFKDYFLFAGVLLGIVLISIFISYAAKTDAVGFMRVFMGVFFLTFGVFKLLDWDGFVESFVNYDLIAIKYKDYAQAYPIIEIVLALGYFLNFYFVNYITLVVTTIGGISVILQLMGGRKIRCACLGTYINIPLSTVSLIEDIAMAAMAILLLILKF